MPLSVIFRDVALTGLSTRFATVPELMQGFNFPGSLWSTC